MNLFNSKERNGKVQLRPEELSAINTLGRQLSSNFSLDSATAKALEELVTITAPDLAMLYLRQGDMLVLKGIRPEKPEFDHLKSTEYCVGNCLCGLAASDEKPVYCINIHLDPRCTLDKCKEAGMHSFAALPLIGREELLGVLGVATLTERDFSRQALFMESLASQVAIALQNALLHEQSEQYLRELEESLKKTIRTEEGLRKSEELYRSFMQNFKGIAYRAKMDFTPVFFHGAVREITGYSEDDFITGGLRWDQLIHPGELDKVFTKDEENLRVTPSYLFEREYRILRKDGKIRWVQEIIQNICDKFGKPIMLQGVIYDITERKRADEERKKLEVQLQQAQKMEKEVPEESKLYRYIQGIREAGKRARNLVGQILAFSRKSEEEKKSIQITPLLKECLKLLRASLPTTIEIRQNVGTQLGNVMADPTQMHQVIMNLCTNAAHAMQGKGGTLEVSLESVDLDTYLATQHPDIKRGKYLKLTVSDTGCGMTMDVMEKIFEPYFTTKEKGVGTGLGLAVIHGIIKGHGGTITVESNPGMGSTFNIFIPVIEEPSAWLTSTSAFLPMGTERILYIDDEEDLVDIAKEMLGSLSYEVVGTTSSIEALKLFRANPGKIDLVITDMAMPKMTGVELAKEFMRIRPDIPIILCTGFSEAITEEEAKALGIREFVLKPILKDKLALTISRVLYENKQRRKKE